MKLPNQSHTTRTGRKEIRLLITALTIALVSAAMILGVHLGQKGLKIVGITVIPQKSDSHISPTGPANRTGMVKAANSMPEIYGPYRGVVDLAHDGDTVNIRLDLGFDITVYARVRVKGINAPELSTDAGKRARDFAQSVLPPGKEVLVTSYGWDKYGGRIDGVITMPSYVYENHIYTNFGTLMLDSGNAVVYNP